LPEEAMILEICKYMGWDYHTFVNQPDDFIAMVVARMEGESLAKQVLNEKYGATK
jgi:hypothetical protein